ncbi:hypothetical protein EOA22_20885 [Mesorhizobium sp. M7A.F.Ca.US.014.04.1.1]|nr:hypothetical protein EOA22_20885 [Mesorhizobium sp. M7A.F.Ca.US.014.04.1.1]
MEHRQCQRRPQHRRGAGILRREPQRALCRHRKARIAAVWAAPGRSCLWLAPPAAFRYRAATRVDTLGGNAAEGRLPA